MKSKEHEQARALRASGLSLNAIRQQVGVSKSSVSKWVRDIGLTDEQIGHLEDIRAIATEKFSATMRLKREARIQRYYEEADKEYNTLGQNSRFLFG